MNETTINGKSPRTIKNLHPDGTEFAPKDFKIPFDTPQGERIYRALAALLAQNGE